MLHGPILDADWIRFESYAHRLKILKIKGNSADILSPSTLHRLGRSIRPVFPNLRRISFPSSSMLSTATFFLLSASLQHLEVRDISEESDVLVTLLYIMTSDAPTLQSLSLDGREATQLSLQPVKQFTNLQSLSLTQMGRLIDDTVLAWISSLTQLTHLTVDLQSSPLTSIPSAFSTLLSLDIAGSLSLILLFLTAVKSTALEDVSFHVLTGGSGYATPAEWKILVNATKSKWLTSLRGFALKDNRALESVLSLSEVFGALWQLKGLERFEVKQHQTTSTLTNADCRHIAESWRMLRVLHIEVRLQEEGPSIKALIDFSKYCPHLRSLSLYVNFAGVQSHPSRHPTSSHGLESLSFGWYAEGNELVVAKCLDNLFPRLKRLKSMFQDYHESRFWEQVKVFIWAFKDVRAEERARFGILDY